MTHASEEPVEPITNLRRRIRVALYVGSWLFFLIYLLLSYQFDAVETAWLSGIFWGLLLTMWCREDAIIAGRPLPTLSLWIVFLFWPIAVPLCVIRIYGVLYGLLLVFLHVMIYVIALAFPAVLSMMEQY